MTGELGSGHHLRLGPDATGKALAQWREVVSALYEIEVPAGTTFAVEGARYQLPRAYLLESTATAHTLSRSRALIARKPIDQVSLYLLKRGRVTAEYDGRELVLQAGDLVLVDYGRPLVSHATDFAGINVAVPRESAPARLRGGGFHGVKVEAASPAGRLLSRHLDALLALVSELPVEAAQAAVDALFTIASSVWPSIGGDAAPAPAAADAKLFDRATRVIDDSLANPLLGPALLCTTLSVTRSALYRAFATTGGVAAHIQRRRLDASLLALVRGDGRSGLVKSVAARHGFKSPTHFTKTFKARFGRSPRELAALGPSGLGDGFFKRWLEDKARAADDDTVAAWLDTVIRSL